MTQRNQILHGDETRCRCHRLAHAPSPGQNFSDARPICGSETSCSLFSSCGQCMAIRCFLYARALWSIFAEICCILHRCKNVFLFFNKNDSSNYVPVSKLCTWNVERTLVLLLELCDRIAFHGHVKLNLTTTSATQIDIYNFVYKFNSHLLYIIMLVTILRY